MVITNAIWDTKNTGLKTCEILFEANDSFQTYLDAEIEKKYDFSVIKMDRQVKSLLRLQEA